MIENSIALPDAPAIDGLVVRPFDPERDYPAYGELIREANLADRLDYVPSAEELASDDRHAAEFDPRRDRIVVELQGALIAAAETDVRTRDGIGVHHVSGWVRSDWRRRGLGHALLGWTERRAHEVARVDGRPPRRSLASAPDQAQLDAIAVYESAGFEPVRYGFTMIRDLAEPIPDLPLPAGLEVRPVEASDHRRIWDADAEAFRDHWDWPERADGDFERWFAAPNLDTSLWQVGWDGDEVAGSAMPFIYPEENAALGVSRAWFDHISVRRPWRRRGLASALITRGMTALRERGIAEAALGVDAENTTGALGVYEALGFRRSRGFVVMKKPFVVD